MKDFIIWETINVFYPEDVDLLDESEENNGSF